MLEMNFHSSALTEVMQKSFIGKEIYPEGSLQFVVT